MHKLFVDIETIPGETRPDPSEIEAPKNYTKAETIRAFQEANADKEWRSQSLNSLKGRIICIGFACNDGPVRSFVGDERDIMVKFTAFVGDLPMPDIIGFNIRAFDLLWLRHRAYKYGLDDLSYVIPWQRYDKRIVDLREVWTGGDTRACGTLDNVCRFVGLEGKSGDGAQIFEMWQSGRLDDIAAYCREDVRLTRELWKRMFPHCALNLGGYARAQEY